MKVLFNLSISYITPENYWIEYPVGLFISTEEIDAVVKRLFSQEGKFSESHCQISIQEISVVGESDNIECVYRFYGQNIDSSAEGDIVESPCYAEKATAIQELIKAKEKTPRQQWHLETHIIGKSNY